MKKQLPASLYYMRKNISFLLFVLLSVQLFAQSLVEQKKEYTRADTLRGSLRPERTCFDVTFYHLDVKIDTGNHSISGSNYIAFKAMADFKTLQLDLYDSMKISSITSHGARLNYRREFNAIFVDMPNLVKKGDTSSLTVYYDGKPTEAVRPPWDGGFTWTYDRDGNAWIAVSCEGMGASLWWPNKDYLGDEPDSMIIDCTIPTGLKCVSNGSEQGVNRNGDGTNTFRWFVHYPINNYNVTLNIGNYVHWSDQYDAQDGDILSLDYYVLPYNLQKSKEQFTQVKPMMACYEKFLGKYPFWNDGYALVETPYLGMEHQGAIAYGNKYKTGYAGMDFSRIGLDFDYIIIHETGHEWWGNSVSCSDIADMWIHEGFCTYTEAIYVECQYGYDTAMRYVNAKKGTVDNKSPVVGLYGVNEEGDGDMYNKGMLFLNTLRHVVNDDNRWWSMIKCMSDTTFKMKNIGYQDVVNYFNRKTGRNLTAVFEQYLKKTDIPVFEYTLTHLQGKNYELSYHWVVSVPNFNMPAFITTDGKAYTQIEATNQWQSTTLSLNKADDFSVNDRRMYINVQKK